VVSQKQRHYGKPYGEPETYGEAVRRVRRSEPMVRRGSGGKQNPRVAEGCGSGCQELCVVNRVSPAWRGNYDGTVFFESLLCGTPAWRGVLLASLPCSVSDGAAPLCGEHAYGLSVRRFSAGTSPRVRGTLMLHRIIACIKNLVNVYCWFRFTARGASHGLIRSRRAGKLSPKDPWF
jgi:hypothetical protein